MVKIKFRVFVTKYCNGTSWPCDKKACKTKHEFPTNRYIFHQVDDDDMNRARQTAWRFVDHMLERENRNDKNKKKQQRPLWQRDIEVA